MHIENVLPKFRLLCFKIVYEYVQYPKNYFVIIYIFQQTALNRILGWSVFDYRGKLRSCFCKILALFLNDFSKTCVCIHTCKHMNYYIPLCKEIQTSKVKHNDGTCALRSLSTMHSVYQFVTTVFNYITLHNKCSKKNHLFIQWNTCRYSYKERGLGMF